MVFTGKCISTSRSIKRRVRVYVLDTSIDGIPEIIVTGNSLPCYKLECAFQRCLKVSTFAAHLLSSMNSYMYIYMYVLSNICICV